MYEHDKKQQDCGPTSSDQQLVGKQLAQHKNASFSQALEWLKQGRHVKRAGWGGYWYLSADVYCQAPSPVGNGYVRGWSFNQLIVAVLKDMGGCAPAQPYQADILANDWEIYFG